MIPPLATFSPNKSGRKSDNSSHVTSPHKMGVMVVNFQSIKNKSAELAVCAELEQPDIIIGTETWIDNSISNSINSEILPNGYTAVRKDCPVNLRTGVAHGGVIIAFRDDLVASHRCDLNTECEIVWLQIDLVGCKPLVIGALYRPHMIRPLLLRA